MVPGGPALEYCNMTVKGQVELDNSITQSSCKMEMVSCHCTLIHGEAGCTLIARPKYIALSHSRSQKTKLKIEKKWYARRRNGTTDDLFHLNLIFLA